MNNTNNGNSLIANQSERPHCQSGNVAVEAVDDVAVASQNTRNVCVEQHMHSEMYQSAVPTTEMRNIEQETGEISGGSSLTLQTKDKVINSPANTKALNNFPVHMHINALLMKFPTKSKKMCAKICTSIKDIMLCKIMLNDLQTDEIDPKQFARSLYSKKKICNGIEKNKVKLRNKHKPAIDLKTRDIMSKSKVKQEVNYVQRLDDIQFRLFPELPTNDKIIFHLDKLLSTLCILKQCNSMSQFICTLNLYLGIYYDRSILCKIFEYFDDIFGVCSAAFLNHIEPPASGWAPYDDSDFIIRTGLTRPYTGDDFTQDEQSFYTASETDSVMENQSKIFGDVRSVLKSWTNIKNSETARKLYKFISVILSTGLCEQTNLTFNYKGFNIFHCQAEEKVQNLTDLVEVIIETSIYFLERGYEAFVTKDAWKLLYSDNTLLKYEQDFSFVVTRISLIESDNTENLGMSLLEYEKLVESVLLRTHDYLKITPAGAYRNILTTKLQQVDRVLVKLIQVRKNTSIRVKPFSLLLFGGSGVGKTTMLNPILHYMMKTNHFPTGGDSICTLNASDKYQSDYSPTIVSVVIDDIANATVAAAEGNHCQLIIDFINNDPKNALKADVDSKGNVMIKPKFVVGTTNRKDLLAYHYSNEPVSIARRFDFTITVEVNAAFRLADSEMLDGSKVQPGIPNCWDFTVERVCPIKRNAGQPDAIGYKIVKWRNIELKRIDMPTLLEFLREQSVEHFRIQDELIRTSQSVFNEELCTCGAYRQFCSCEPLMDNQNKVMEFFSTYEKQLLGTKFLLPIYLSSKRIVKDCVETLWKKIDITNRFYQVVWTVISFITIVFSIFSITTLALSASVIGSCYYSCIKFDRFVDRTIAKCEKLDNALTIFRIQDKQKARRYIKIAGYGVITISTLYSLRSLYKRYKSLHNQSDEIKTPEPDTIVRINPWKVANREPIPVSIQSRTTTHQQLVDKCANVTSYMFCEEMNTGKKFASNAFPISSNLWLINKHAVGNEEIHATFIRRDPNKVGSNFKAILSPVHMVPIEDTEFMLVYVPSGGDNKNMIPYLPLTRQERACAATLIYKDDKAVVKIQKVKANPRQVVSNTISVRGYAYTTQYPTFFGQCMSVLVSDDITPRILGFHFAGNTGSNMGGACSVTQDDVCYAIDQIKERFGVCLSVNTGTLRLEEQGGQPNVKILETIHAKSPLNFLDDNATVVAYGSHDGTRRKFTSRVTRTLISPLVEEVMGVECKHGPPPEMNSWKPWRQDLNNMAHVKAVSPTLLMCAAKDFETKIFDNLPHSTFKRVHPLSNDSNLSGADGVYGIDSINMKSSMGHPWNKPKTHYLTRSDVPLPGITQPIVCPSWIWDEVNKAEETLLKDERYYMVFRANLKDEPTKVTKKKVRVFCGAPITGLLLVRKYYLPLAKVIMENSELFECAVGINAHGPDWTKFTKHVTKYGSNRMVAGDYKDYDSTMPASVTLAAFQILINMARKAGYNEQQLKIMQGIATEICYPLYEYNGEFIQIFGSNPSGHPLTVFINSFANSLYIRCAYYHIYPYVPEDPFDEHVALMCYGDDNIMSISEDRPDFNHTTIAQAMAVYNITYTMAQKDQESIPYIDLSQCTFLKRSMVWSAELQQYLGPIEEASLFKTLHCVLESKVLTPQEHSVESIKCVLDEYFLFGEDIYNDRVEKLTEICRRAQLLHHFEGALPTYEDQQDSYVERYLSVTDGCKTNPHSSHGVGTTEMSEPDV